MGDGFGLGGFNFDFGTDPFGGGSEGLAQVAQPVADVAASPAPSSFADVAKGVAGGIGGGLKTGLDTFGGLAKSIVPAAQLGLAGMGVKTQLDAASQAKQQGKRLDRAQQLQEKAAQPLTDFGTRQIQRAEGGQVEPAVQAQIDQWVQGAKQQAAQWFAHNGITDSTMMESVMRDIDQKAVAMKAGDIHLMEQMGIGALQAGAGAASGMAGTAQQEQNSLDALIGQANKALASMLA